MKAPVTLSGCGAFAVYGASVSIPKSPAFRPSSPAKTGTVSVFSGAGFPVALGLGARRAEAHTASHTTQKISGPKVWRASEIGSKPGRKIDQ